MCTGNYFISWFETEAVADNIGAFGRISSKRYFTIIAIQ